MGEDYWRYGIGENRTELDALCRYSFDQGLSVRQLAPEDLFAEPVRELFKIWAVTALEQKRPPSTQNAVFAQPV